MQVIGENVPRVDAFDKATGRAKYTADYTLPGTLEVVLVRASVAHAVIRGIVIPEHGEDVYCYTAKDLACNVIPSIKNDQPALAEKKIRYAGEPYAVVAADTREKAAAFAKTIKLLYDPLPAVDDMEEALEEDAPLIFEDGNVCSEVHYKKGDAGAALSSCALVLENTFRLPVQTHGFLETESAFTYIDEKGRLALISSTQNAFDDRKGLAQVLGLPLERVTSMAPAVGGAFGGKDGITAQIYPAIVTYYTRRPARCVFTREEHVRYGMKRHSAHIRVKAGFDGDGRLLAFTGRIHMDTGAYGLLGPAVLELGTEQMTGPYFIPNVTMNGWLAYTNHAPASAMRGFGAPQTCVVMETIMNRAAEHFGLSAIEIRRRNALHTGQTNSMGPVMDHSFGFEEALDALEKTDLYREMTEHPEPGCGYGLSAGIKSSGMGKGIPDYAVVEIEKKPDGRFTVRTGLVDIGQGGAAANRMMAAEALGVSPDKVDIVMGDTEQTPECGSTAASRCTFLCANAIAAAAKEILSGKNYAVAKADFPEVEGRGVHSIFASLAEIAKIRIDRVTGAVNVLDVVNVTDAGTIIHPGMMAGQIFGGIVMSEGYTLSEQIRCRVGVTAEDGFNSYIMPTALDAPRLTNINVPVPEGSCAFGAKGIGEASTSAIAPAITAAVSSLCPGLTVTSLPISREDILRTLA